MPSGPADHPEITFLRGLLPDRSLVGRNDPCPCGSGRKFKVCCQANPVVPADRSAAWLFHKLATYSDLKPSRGHRFGLAASAADGAEGPDALGDEQFAEVAGRFLQDPFLLDLAVFEMGTIELFVEERSVLLPAVELDMLAAWATTRRRLWEITEVEPGRSIRLRDTTSGDTVEVVERSASTSLEVGELLLARVVPVAAEHQLIGQPVTVELRQRQTVLQILDEDPSGDAFAFWYGRLHAPPVIRNREGEELLDCSVVVRLSTGIEPDALLADLFEPGVDGQWVDLVDVGGERLVRSFLSTDDEGDLVVTSNSAARVDRVLDRLRSADPDLQIVSDERRPFEVPSLGDLVGGSPQLPGLALPDLGPEARSILDQVMRDHEQRWLDESVPALAGLTPRQAAADPTRREDLLALLREFDQSATSMPEGMASFDVGRLRRELGLGAEI